MGHSPYYPDDVTDEMIDEAFGDDGSCCKYCSHYFTCDSSCALKEWALETDIEKGDVEEMTDEEFQQAITVDEEDYCDDFEWRDDGIEEER